MKLARLYLLPKIEFNKDTHKAIHFCIVCMEEFQNKQRITYLPCDPRHFFHTNCIRIWLVKSDTCPICKEEVDF